MYIDDSVISFEEKMILNMRTLYSSYGYRSYKINKFEEYDFYVRNKDFLVSDGIISFTDKNGKLMALKPDVTLSIVNNHRYEAGKIRKLYYDEKVYRVTTHSGGYKEITQVGLEALGDIDDGTVSEVLRMAALSLETVEKDYVLNISHTGLIREIVSSLGIGGEAMDDMIRAIGNKAFHEIEAIAVGNGIDSGKLALIRDILHLPEDCGEALKKIESLQISEAYGNIVSSLKSILLPLKEYKIRIDFSVPANMRYYNGIVMNGFVKSVPQALLSGGRYDPLMRRIGKQGGAIGFAVYLDLLEG